MSEQEFAFDVEIAGVIRVLAEDSEAALRRVQELVHCYELDAPIGNDSKMTLTEISLIPGKAKLFEAGGKMLDE